MGRRGSLVEIICPKVWNSLQPGLPQSLHYDHFLPSSSSLQDQEDERTLLNVHHNLGGVTELREHTSAGLVIDVTENYLVSLRKSYW